PHIILLVTFDRKHIYSLPNITYKLLNIVLIFINILSDISSFHTLELSIKYLIGNLTYLLNHCIISPE
uniref:hypothetical protein n=1 Tax=Clostridium prolinivorans TaxID=2769420 RepID=UPI00196A9B7C